jgi:exodeoxyribonuclease-3
MFRIATWNVNSLRVRLPHVLGWLDSGRPDVLALQETKSQDKDFPLDSFAERGYHVLHAGQKTYNGVAILSLRPGTLVADAFPDFEDPQRRVLHARIGNIQVLNLYVPNGSEVGSEKFEYKLRWLARLRKYVAGLLGEKTGLAVVGDFNIAPAPEDVHDPAAWEGQVLFSAPEREEFSKLLQLGLVDCYRLFPQPPGGFTWWDYRTGAFRRNDGLRIDHVLASRSLAARCRGCRIDLEPRRLERPSDHAPVIAEFDL